MKIAWKSAIWIVVILCSIEKSSASSSCDGLHHRGYKKDGQHSIRVFGKITKVYCEFNEPKTSKTWLVIQRRNENGLSFNKNWNSYKKGFGDMNDEFWLGLEKIHAITKSKQYMLRVELTDFRGKQVFAEYKSFKVKDSNNSYALAVNGYRGNSGDALAYHDGMPFSTYDHDKDLWGGNCAAARGGGFWFNACCYANLNGHFYRERRREFDGILWYPWKHTTETLRRVQMKIRPISKR